MAGPHMLSRDSLILSVIFKGFALSLEVNQIVRPESSRVLLNGMGRSFKSLFAFMSADSVE